MSKTNPTNGSNTPSNESRDLIADAQALMPSLTPSRRDFLRNTGAAGLAVGFAVAVQPVAAQQIITTDASDLQTGIADINENGISLTAYYAKPKQSSNRLPLIVVCSEIFGVHEHIADIARRFAKQGYLAIAPAFFSRVGDPASLSSVPDILKQIISKTPDAQVMDDIRATLAWGIKHGANPDQIGVTGFCWGGRITWLACAQIPQFKAGVAWYGRLVGETNQNFPAHPVDVAKDLKAPVLGLYGGKDDGIPLNTVEQMRQALATARDNPAAAASRIEVYPDAPHAFHADYRPTFRQEAAQDGWQRCLAWLKRYGV